MESAQAARKRQAEMKMYSGFSAFGGSEEGSVLIFANTAREAKKVAYPVLVGLDIVEDWLDVGVRWIRNSDYLRDHADQAKLARNEPHVIDDPPVCKTCELWGGELFNDGTCSLCD